MYELDKARRDCKQVHLTLMMLIEMTRHQGGRATPHSLAPQITGAPVRRVAETLEEMCTSMKVITRVPTGYMVSPLGAEVLNAEIEGWSPSPEEQRRRDMYLASARVGEMRR